MTAPLVLPDGVRLPLRNELEGPRAERDRLWAQVEKASLRPGFVVHSSESPEFACFFEVNVDANRLWRLFVALAVELFGQGMSFPMPADQLGAADTNADTDAVSESDTDAVSESDTVNVGGRSVMTPPPMVPRHAVSESDTVNVDGVDDGVSTAGGDTTVEGAGAHCQLLLSDADEELALIGTAPLSQILQPLGEIDYQLAHDGWIHFGLVSESEGRVSGVFVTPTKHLQVWAQDREIVASVLRGHGLVERDELAFLASYPVVVEPPEHAPSEFLSAGDLRIALGEEIAPG